MLPVDFIELVELRNVLIRFQRPVLSVPESGMGLNRFEQILCPPVVQEKDALPEAPHGAISCHRLKGCQTSPLCGFIT
jgi:hypothetical protein